MNYKFVLFINLQQIQIDLENMVKGVGRQVETCLEWKSMMKFTQLDPYKLG